MPIQGLRFNIASQGEAHLSFQATGSFTAYNPNDGYALIALDRTATLLDYDHKLPSQSGGHFPGPINSYLSIFYLDQSGANVSGQLIVYASPDVVQIPQFWSIGRAIQSQVTTLDITQGTIPPNPPINNTRLWVDGNGNLHLLNSAGTDKTVIDSATPLGADLYGTVPAAHVGVQNGSAIYGYDSTHALRYVYQPTGDNFNAFFCNTAGLLIVNSLNSLRLITIDNTGNIYLTGGGLSTGPAFGGGWPIKGDINVARGDGTGYVFLANSTHYIGFDGSQYRLISSPLLMDSYINLVNSNARLQADGTNLILASAGGIYLRGDSNVYVQTQAGAYAAVNTYQIVFQAGSGAGSLYAVSTPGGGGVQSSSGGGDYVMGGGSSKFYFHPNLSVHLDQNYPYLDMVGFTCFRVGGGANFQVQGTSTGYQFGGGAAQIIWNGTYLNMSHSMQFNTPGNQLLWSNGSYISGNAGYVQGSKEELKENLVVLTDVDCLTQVLDERMIVHSYNWPDDSRQSLGFIAEEVAEVLPLYVIRDEENNPAGYVPQELTTLLWGAVRELARRLPA